MYHETLAVLAVFIGLLAILIWVLLKVRTEDTIPFSTMLIGTLTGGLGLLLWSMRRKREKKVEKKAEAKYLYWCGQWGWYETTEKGLVKVSNDGHRETL